MRKLKVMKLSKLWAINALMIPIMLYSCKNEKDETILEPEVITLDADGLPKPTSLGLNSFGFIENALPWWGSNEQQANSLIGRKSPNQGKFLQLTLTVQERSNNSYKYMLIFQLDTARLSTGYSYSLKRPNNDNSSVSIEQLILNPVTSTAHSRMDWSDNTNPSTLTVTRYDRTKRILAGTFSLNTAYFVITKGRFDIKLEN